MGNSIRIRVFIVIAFLTAFGLLYYAYDRMQLNVKSLVRTVEESASPDRDLIRIKELWSGINAAGNNVRAYSMSRDEGYLVQFLDIKDTLKAGIDSLQSNAIQSGRSTEDLSVLDSLLEAKVMVYDSLLEINYNRVISAAIDKMDENELKNDTTGIFIDQGNMLQRMFSGKYSRKKLQVKADSLLAERNSRISEFNKNLSKIKVEEARQLKEQTDKELALLQSDKLITSKIERVISRLEKEERARILVKAVESKQAATSAAAEIRKIVIVGLVLILLLMLFVMRDIEVANKRRKELVKARLEAEKLAKAKEEFMATMSHEIRTPLTSVIGFSAKLEQTNLDPVQQRYMKAISGSSEHLLSIVNDVLDFTRVDSGKLRFDEVSFKAKDIFTEVYDSMVWKAEEKGLQLTLFIQPINTLVLHGDPVRLRQVLFNLVGNAIKFTERGTVDITATFTEEHGKAVLLIKVSDTGIGIPQDRHEAIFGEFEQADSNTEKKYGGSGLGLSISKRIVEQLGGSIQLESSPAIGSVFIVRIPYKWGELEERETSFTEDVNDQPLKGLSIILAEDDPMIRELQLHSLENLGAKVLVAEDGKQAVDHLRKSGANLILMDIQMPEMTGPEALKIIRSEFPANKKNIPVIAMTANILQHDLKRWLDEGMTDFITKPFREQELLEKISKHLKIDVQAVAEKQFIPVEVQEEYKFNQPRPDKIYDLSELIDSSQGNTEFIRKMINLFLTSSFASVNNLRFHLKQNNWEQLGKTAHRMIGSYKQMGIGYAAAMLKELENTSSGSRELGKAAWLVNEIDAFSAEVFRLLKEELENYS